MTRRERRDAAAAATEDFSLDPDADELDLCEHAENFANWADQICDQAHQKHSVVAVNQALVLLVKQYFSWRAHIPKRHRSRSGKLRHACVTDVFESTYTQLRELELSIVPPLLTTPSPPPPVIVRSEPKDRIDGIVVGRMDPDPEFDGE